MISTSDLKFAQIECSKIENENTIIRNTKIEDKIWKKIPQNNQKDENKNENRRRKFQKRKIKLITEDEKTPN